MTPVALSIPLLLAAGVAAAAQTPLEIADIHLIADLSEPAPSPDGEFIYYTLSTHNLDTDETVSDVWRVGWDGRAPANMTKSQNKSEWSPRPTAGGAVAYLSDAGPHDEAQVWIQPGRGPAFQASDIVGGVSAFDISPDGSRIVAVAETGESVRRGAPRKPIVIDRFYFKEDGRGRLGDRRSHLFLVDIAAGTTARLTYEDRDHWSPRFSPDGERIAFVSKERGDTDRNLDTDVYVMAAAPRAEPRRISTFQGADADPSWESGVEWSPDGGKLVWLQAMEDKWIYYAPLQLAVADVNTGDVTTPARIDKWFSKPRWSPDGRKILSIIEQDRTAWLAEIDLEAGNLRYLTEGARFAFDFAISPSGETAVLDGDAGAPYELRLLGSNSRPLTAHNGWLAKRKLLPYRDISFRRGGAEVRGMLLLPEGVKNPPLIVRLHGGPVYQYSHEFMFDWQYYAAHGYAVLAVNPRGSSGRGFDFARSIYADWGDKDADDIIAAIDHVIDAGVVDPDRIGVGGWSYGGILTNYLIATDSRIKAAASGAGMSNFIAGYGADQYAREYEMELGQPWRKRQNWDRVSFPFYNADRIKAATLFMCAEDDVNVPCIGSEQMYLALKSEGVQTQLVVYPGETHGLSIPSFIRDRLDRQLRWYDRHLKDAAD